MVFAVWAAPEPVVDGLLDLEHALVASVRLARVGARAARLRGERALRLSGRLPRPLLREAPLQLRAARARRALHLPRDGARRRRARPRARAPLRRARRRRCDRHRRAGSARSATSSRRRSTASGSPTTTPSRCSRSRDLVAVGRVANELRSREDRSATGHVHRRPEPQLHERLRHRLRLLRLLPPPGRRARGLPAAEAGDLQEDRGDARDRRHRAADAGRPPPGSRHRLLRGSLPLDQGALPDPPARALAARDPAHRAALEADDPGDAVAPARRRARLRPRRRRRDPRRPRARDHRAEEDEVRRVARRDAPGAPARDVDDRDDDVRPRRDARGAGRAHAPGPRAPGRDARLPRLHLVDVPARRQPARRARPARTRARRRSTTCSRRRSRASTSTTSRTSSRRG